MAANRLRVRVRATPRAGRDSVGGRAPSPNDEPILRVAVVAAPDDGAANAAISALLAKAFDVKARAVTLLSGAAQRAKVFEIEGEASRLAARLDELLAAEGVKKR